MKCLVCIKQGIETGDMGRFERIALEAALYLKSDLGTDRPDSRSAGPVGVDVVTVGDCGNIIPAAFGLGADDGIHIRVRETATPFTVASLVAEAGAGYDIIFFGDASEDGMAGQTGPMTAQLMQRPWLTGVVRVRPGSAGRIRVTREMDGGVLDHLRLRPPCILAVRAHGHPPMYPALSRVLAGKSRPVNTIEADRLISEGVPSRSTVVSLEDPEQTRAGQVLAGSPADLVRGFCRFLQERHLP